MTATAAIKAAGISKDYDLDFEDFITGFGRMDKRIELMNELKRQVKAVKIKPSNEIGTLDVRGDKANNEFYTTKHYFNGRRIQKVIREFLEYNRSLRN